MTFAAEREELVQQLRDRGIRDERVLQAVRDTPRERFVPAELRRFAYADRALSIGQGQTISQPYMVALMTQELRLRGDERILEIGTGSGYQAAILARLCGHVVTVERLPELSESAQKVLDGLELTNLAFHVGDGTLGFPPEAPYDAIVVTAAPPEVPRALFEQLADGGRLVVPVGPRDMQELQVITRKGDRATTRNVCPCVFVKLIGAQGWAESD